VSRPPSGSAALLLLCALALAPAARARPPDSASIPRPSAVLKTFDSLLEAGRLPQARLLCAGQMLRMFDFIAMAHSKTSGLLDTSRTKEIVLEEKDDGTWAYVKISGLMVFTRPFMGQDSIRSVQAAHLYRPKAPQAPNAMPARGGWLIAEIEELESETAPVRLRSGSPPGSGNPAAETASRSLFPVSSRAPERAGEADRLRYRLRLRNGAPLSQACRLGPDQILVRAVSPSEWILENRRDASGERPGGVRAVDSGGFSRAALPPDTLRTYLASNAFLVLEDTLLSQTAARIAGTETDPLRVTDAVYRWVTDRFRFKLGAVLFGTSSGILRDLTGDCSEAAVLTAALLRARGVPSRVALGFASLGRGVFIGHAWSEAWIRDRWVGVDAALREFPAGVERVKLSELDGRADMRIAATNVMMGSIANLEIEILQAWKQGKPLKLKAFPDNSAEAGRFFEEILGGAGSDLERAR
jgi:transglutaminase-like putative cysteine protease